MVKIVVFDEHFAFVSFFIEKVVFFLFCILIRGSFGDVLGIENRFVVIEKSICFNKIL